MLDIIRFKNYRIFRTEQELQLCPITIVFGKNNSGKSAVLKLPILIENILANELQFNFSKNKMIGKSTKNIKGNPIISQNFSPYINIQTQMLNINEKKQSQKSLNKNNIIDSIKREKINTNKKINKIISIESNDSKDPKFNIKFKKKKSSSNK